MLQLTKNRIDLISAQEKKQAKKVIDRFKKDKSEQEIFYDLCFCVLAPQTTFVANRKVIAELIRWGFYFWRERYENEKDGDLQKLKEIVKPTRFYNNKAKYLNEILDNFPIIFSKMRENLPAVEKRDWLVRNVKGLGMKAASHFLRNLGNKDLAIIDVHVMKFMELEYIAPKNKKEYLAIEKEFGDLAKSLSLSVAELDAIIWIRYSGTDWEDFNH